jgi:RimJ/RimL family protein N-acetyltransferase
MNSDLRSERRNPINAIDCPVIVTDRLVLRKPMAEDIADINVLANNINVARMLSRMPHPYSQDDARAFVEKASAGGFDGCIYACTLAENGKFIGCAGLEDLGAGPEIGYWLGEPFWGLGYATEMVEAIVDLAFRATDLDQLIAGSRTANAASRRVLEKCGFRFAGTERIPSAVLGWMEIDRCRLEKRDWFDLKSEQTRRRFKNDKSGIAAYA